MHQRLADVSIASTASIIQDVGSAHTAHGSRVLHRLQAFKVLRLGTAWDLTYGGCKHTRLRPGAASFPMSSLSTFDSLGHSNDSCSMVLRELQLFDWVSILQAVQYVASATDAGTNATSTAHVGLHWNH